MKLIRLIALLLFVFNLQACAPISAVGAIGSTITNAAYNEAERRNKSSYVSPEQRRLEIARANLKLGIAYMQNGQLDKAFEKLDRGMLAKRDYAPLHNAMGLLHSRMGQDEMAERYFHTAIDLEPDNSSFKNNYGLFLCQHQRYDEADDIFTQAAENPLYATPEIALTNAGTCAKSNGDISQAEIYFDQAIRQNANVSQALIQMTEIKYDRGEYDSAHFYLERYKSISNHTPKSLWLGVKISEQLGNRDDASSYALLLKNRFPDTDEAALLQSGI